jgi:phage shock protein PspC (stress-responsive transcriptional regulator)
MKKNISINLQGIIFHLEDDGYEVLSRYLHEVKAHFASYQGHEEIVADIEGRIAELFSARLSVNKQVITLIDVEEMTAKMGRVSDFATEPDEEDQEPAAATGTAGGTFGPNGPFGPKGAFGPEGTFGPDGPFAAGRDADGQPRRLYRDLAHRKIAGVAAGLAQYFRVNPLLVRLVFVALVLLPNVFGIYDHFPGTGMFRHRFDFGGLALIAYIVLWIALPKRADAPAPIDTLDFGGKLTGRKLFRDTDNGKVGGVSAGLAAYFQTDVVLVRVLFLIGLFLGGSTFLIYLVLWAVVPEARTVSEKMQMRGDDVTLSGIDNNLRSNAIDGETPSPNRPLGTYLESAARQARPAVGFIGTLIRWGVAAWLIFTGGTLLVGVLVALGAALSIIPFTAIERTRNGFMFDDSFGAVVRNLPPWGAIAGGLATGIPALAMILLGLRLILRRPPLSRTVSSSLLGLWILGIMGSFAAGLQVARDFQTKDTYDTTVRLNAIVGPGIVLDSRNVEDHFQWVNLHLAPADSGAAPYVEESFQARGRTEEAARLTAQQTINYTITQHDSTIIFDQGTTLKSSAPYRDQKLTLTLHLPLNKIYRLTPLFIEHLDDDDFTNGHRPNTDGDKSYRARFTREGKFTCLDCPISVDEADDNDGDQEVSVGVNGQNMKVRVDTDGDEPRVTVSNSEARFNTDPSHYGSGRKTLDGDNDFNEVEVHGAFRVVVRQGDTYKVEAAGRSADLADVRLDVRGDRLVVRNRAGGDLFSAFDMSKNPILVQVTLPHLQHLELSGACQADVSGFQGDELRLEASSASSARLNVNVPRLELSVSSASRVDLSGAADELSIDGSSASQVEALGLRATRVDLDLSSASQARVHATEELKADLSSGSTAHYTGNPTNVQKDLSSGSTLERVND